jgi:hypothetical protein
VKLSQVAQLSKEKSSKKAISKIERSKKLNSKVEALKMWLLEYNFKILLGNLTTLILLSCHTKESTGIESIFGMGVSAYLLKHEFTIFKIGDSCFTGFGVKIWLNLAQTAI